MQMNLGTVVSAWLDRHGSKYNRKMDDTAPWERES